MVSRILATINGLQQSVQILVRATTRRSTTGLVSLLLLLLTTATSSSATTAVLVTVVLASPTTTTTPTTTTPPQQPAPTTTPPPIRGWLGLGPRLELGRSLVEAGLDVQGGAWLLREHLQPLASLGWSVAARDGLSLNTVRLGLGLAAGAPLRGGRLWLGGHALAHGSWTLAHDARNASSWASSSELGALLQLRWPRWLLGLRSGVDLALPVLRARGTDTRLQRGPAQFVLGLQFALVFG